MWKYDLGGLVGLILLAIAYVFWGESLTPDEQTVPFRWRLRLAGSIVVATVATVLLIRFW